jgi:ribonuclease P protein component
MTRVVARAGDPPRVAYAIGRRTGNAVVRNRLRRQLRSLVREHRDQLQPGHAYLIGARPDTVTATYRELDDALSALLDATERRS